MLGYDPFRARLLALALSGLYAGAAGAAYGLLFGYVGATFASVQYSILPLLWVLLGGAGTVLGPLVGTALMFYLLDLAARVTDATLLVVGLALMALVLFAPRGLLGALRAKAPDWLRMNLLETRGLTRHFGGLKAVENVDFDLAPGEIHALIGPNGAGKTTFVGLICGRLRPDRGTIRFDGRDITRLPAHARVRLGIAYTFQITSIYPRLPVYDNVALAVQRSGAADLTAGAFAALARVGLEDHARATAGTLAYGHQRLLEIAMGLALAPEAPHPRRADPGPRRRRDRRLQGRGPRGRPHRHRAPHRAQHGRGHGPRPADHRPRLRPEARHRHPRRHPRRPRRPRRLPRPVMTLTRRPTSTPATARSGSCAASPSRSPPARSSASWAATAPASPPP